MDVFSIFIKMAELFSIMVIGYCCCRFGFFKKQARADLTKVIVNIAIPALNLSAVLTTENLPSRADVFRLMLAAVLFYLFMMLLAVGCSRLPFFPKNKRGLYSFMFSFPNVGFIGYPVTQAIFGSQAVFYTCIFTIPLGLFMYSVGIIFVRQDAEENDGEKTGLFDNISYKLFLTPSTVSAAGAILLALLGIQSHGPVGETCSMIGAMTTPGALLVIGSALAELPVRDMFGNARVYLFAAIRMLAFPALIYLLFGLFISDPLLLGECTILSSMPVATNGTMICLEYGGDEKLMAQGTFITTLFSMLTIPLLSMLF